MYNKKGFLLLSFLVYLMLFSIITFFMGNIITRLIIPSFISLKKNQSIIALHMAGDFFVRDIRNSGENIHRWKVISPHELIWEKDSIYIGWSFFEGRLERKEGLYNGQWKEAKKSIVANNILNATFIPKKDTKNIMRGLTLSLTSSYMPQKTIICDVAIKKSEKR